VRRKESTVEKKTLRYPGDPDQPIVIMTGAEFKRDIRGGKPGYLEVGPMKSGTLDLDRESGQVQRIEFDEVVCDTCNKEILDEDFLAMDRSRAVCKECFDEHWKPWILA
jgi:hypothetical protein